MPRCKQCKEKFEAKYFNQKHCMIKDECIQAHVVYVKEQKAKAWRKEKKQIKERLKTHSEHLRELQKIFNTFIRLRDKDQRCISCNKVLGKKYDAGHYYSVGSCPGLRFNEDNCHAQCVHCNQHQHGNVGEYTIHLPGRIGADRFRELVNTRNEPLKLSIPEIQELKKVYKGKIKALRNPQ